MKKNLLIALVVCLAPVAAALAQPYNMIRVNLPGPVVVGSATLPAGEFLIMDMNVGGSASIVMIRSESGPAATLLMDRTGEVKDANPDHEVVSLKNTAKGYEIQSLQMNGQEYRSLQR